MLVNFTRLTKYFYSINFNINIIIFYKNIVIYNFYSVVLCSTTGLHCLANLMTLSLELVTLDPLVTLFQNRAF